MRHSRIHRSAAGLAGLALLAAGAAGCGRAEPDVVAYVGDQKITERQLDDAVAGVSKALPQADISERAVASAMVHGLIAERIAAQAKIVITNDQRDALLKGSNLAPLLTVPAAIPVAYDLADQQMIAQTVGPPAYLAATEKASVTLNPRFGVLDPTEKSILQGMSGSLAKPVPPTQ